MGKGMKAGKKPKAPGAGDMQKQMARVQAMQREMEAAQAEIEKKEITATAGGGAVTVKVSGKREVTAIELKPEIVDPDDIEMLQDLVMVAVNDGLHQIDAITEEEMGKITGGLSF